MSGIYRECSRYFIAAVLGITSIVFVVVAALLLSGYVLSAFEVPLACSENAREAGPVSLSSTRRHHRREDGSLSSLTGFVPEGLRLSSP